jgi:hypothetical protein
MALTRSVRSTRWYSGPSIHTASDELPRHANDLASPNSTERRPGR